MVHSLENYAKVMIVRLPITPLPGQVTRFSANRHYNDVTMSAMASQITVFSTVCSTIGSGAHQRKHQSTASLALCVEFIGDRWIPTQKASNAENVSIWWRHHASPTDTRSQNNVPIIWQGSSPINVRSCDMHHYIATGSQESPGNLRIQIMFHIHGDQIGLGLHCHLKRLGKWFNATST